MKMRDRGITYSKQQQTTDNKKQTLLNKQKAPDSK